MKNPLIILAAICLNLFCSTAMADRIVIKSAEKPLEKPKNLQQTLKIKTFKGVVFDLGQHKGNVSIVNFWAYWCKICKSEMTVLNRLHAAMPKIGIIGISIDNNYEKSLAQNVVKNIFYPNAIIGDVIESSFETPSSVPVTYILNASGEVKRIIEGGFSESDIRSIVEEVAAL